MRNDLILRGNSREALNPLYRIVQKGMSTHNSKRYNIKIPWLKGKGKVIPLHAMEALGVRGGIAPTLS
jgi:hypothetical protein